MFSNKIVILLLVCTFITLDMESRCGWRYILYHKYVYFSIFVARVPREYQIEEGSRGSQRGSGTGRVERFYYFHSPCAAPALFSINSSKQNTWMDNYEKPVLLSCSTSGAVYQHSCLPSVLSTSCPAQMNYLRVMNNVLGVF